MKNSAIKILNIICIVLIVAIMLFSILIAMNVKNFGTEIESITKNRLIINHIRKNDNYKLIDDIWDTPINVAVSVYQTNFETVDAAARDIIATVPERVKKVTEDGIEDTKCLGIITELEYAYIYEHDGKIFVQNSRLSYLDDAEIVAYHEEQNDSIVKAFEGDFENNDYEFFIIDASKKLEIKNKPLGSGVSPVN